MYKNKLQRRTRVVESLPFITIIVDGIMIVADINTGI